MHTHRDTYNHTVSLYSNPVRKAQLASSSNFTNWRTGYLSKVTCTRLQSWYETEPECKPREPGSRIWDHKHCARYLYFRANLLSIRIHYTGRYSHLNTNHTLWLKPSYLYLSSPAVSNWQPPMMASIPQPEQCILCTGASVIILKHSSVGSLSCLLHFGGLPIHCEKGAIQTMPVEVHMVWGLLSSTHISPFILESHLAPAALTFLSFKQRNFILFLEFCSCSFLRLDHSSSRSLHGCIHFIISVTDKTPLTSQLHTYISTASNKISQYPALFLHSI